MGLLVCMPAAGAASWVPVGADAEASYELDTEATWYNPAREEGGALLRVTLYEPHYGVRAYITPVRLFYHLEPWTMLQFDAKLLNDDGLLLATYPKVRAVTAEDGSPERVIMESIRQQPLGKL